MYRIFIVEDDPVIAGSVRRHIESWGFGAVCAESFDNVMAEFVACAPQLVLLDISLPFFNGYHWCSEIRRVSSVPIIFISSSGDNMNIVMAMNMGADDFITKPFDLAVLTAKVQALLRRAYDYAPAGQLMECRGMVLNVSDATASVAGRRVELTRNELRILQLLMEKKGRVVARDVIMTRLWESDSFVDENTLTVNVTRLRRKLADAGLTELIRTVKGQGYIIDE